MTSSAANGKEHPTEFYDEVERDCFFLPEGTRVLGCQEELSTLLCADEGVALIVHLGRECTTHYVWLDHVRHYRHMYPRFSRLPMRRTRGNFYMLEASNLELMLGKEQRIRSVIKRALEHEATKIVVLVTTCVAEMVGLRLEDILEQEAGGSGVPAFCIELTIDQNLPLSDMWYNLLMLARPRRRSDSQRVNLLGFGELDSVFGREVNEILKLCGMTLNAWLVPEFDTAMAEGFLAAGTSLVCSSDLAEQETWGIRQRFPAAKFLDVPPPFGPEACWHLYRAIVKAGGKKGVPSSVRKIWVRWYERWLEAAGPCANWKVGFVLRPGDEKYLLEPGRYHGLDPIRILREMGFGVLVHFLGGEKQAEALRHRLELRYDFDRKVQVVAHGKREQIDEVLKASPARLFFTDYEPDWRILKAGKVPLTRYRFEPGMAGAYKTARTLSRMASSGTGRWGIYS